MCRRHVSLLLLTMVICIPIAHKTSVRTNNEATRTNKYYSTFEHEVFEVEKIQATENLFNPHADAYNMTLDEPKSPEKWVDLGEFKVTYYCSCSKCCGKWSKYNKTKIGTTPKAGRTIAVDPDLIPLGSTVMIFGNEYIAEDTGSAVGGKHIDIYCSSHDECFKFLARYGDVAEVKVKEE